MRNSKYVVRLLIRWRGIQRAFYRAFPTIERQHFLQYAEGEYGYTREFLEQVWEEANERWTPGEKGFLGQDTTVGSTFFSMLAEREFDESVAYTCVEGCCTILWDEIRGRSVASFGPAGCPCNDERDLSTRRAS